MNSCPRVQEARSRRKDGETRGGAPPAAGWPAFHSRQGSGNAGDATPSPQLGAAGRMRLQSDR
ncbi:MAG TPA: hypothetical protein VHB01_03180 [Nitrosospira sp.]|nr:hypothetical protein [Nitrosospira sp.]